ncbi:hypothetical protein M514_27277, partial [Trichuris suis]
GKGVTASECQCGIRTGEIDIYDRSRSGRPKESDNGDLRALLDQNSAASSQELAKALGARASTVSSQLRAM